MNRRLSNPLPRLAKNPPQALHGREIKNALAYRAEKGYLKGMEKFDLLEQRVGELLTAMNSLREENHKLREDVAASQQLLEENYRLQEELKQQKLVREEALSRVDALVQRLTLGLDGKA